VPNKRKIIKDDQCFKWLPEYPRFTVSDVELVTMFSTELWTDQTAAQMLVKTGRARRMEEVLWIRDGPNRPFQLTPSITMTIYCALHKSKTFSADSGLDADELFCGCLRRRSDHFDVLQRSPWVSRVHLTLWIWKR
jgi:asparagine synthetase B (glutamine-hydrolysing)